MDDHRDAITTVFEVLAVLLVAFGAAAWAFQFIGWASAAVAGVVLFGASAVDNLVLRRSQHAGRGR